MCNRFQIFLKLNCHNFYVDESDYFCGESNRIRLNVSGFFRHARVLSRGNLCGIIWWILLLVSLGGRSVILFHVLEYWAIAVTFVLTMDEKDWKGNKFMFRCKTKYFLVFFSLFLKLRNKKTGQNEIPFAICYYNRIK